MGVSGKPSRRTNAAHCPEPKDAQAAHAPKLKADQAAHLLKIEEVLQQLRIGRSTFYLLVKKHKLRIVKVEGASRVLDSDVDAYIASLLSPSSPEPQ